MLIKRSRYRAAIGQVPRSTEPISGFVMRYVTGGNIQLGFTDTGPRTWSILLRLPGHADHWWDDSREVRWQKVDAVRLGLHVAADTTVSGYY